MRITDLDSRGNLIAVSVVINEDLHDHGIAGKVLIHNKTDKLIDRLFVEMLIQIPKLELAVLLVEQDRDPSFKPEGTLIRIVDNHRGHVVFISGSCFYRLNRAECFSCCQHGFVVIIEHFVQSEYRKISRGPDLMPCSNVKCNRNEQYNQYRHQF